MKKVFAILCVLALALCSLTALAEGESGLALKLAGNPTTGYEWQYTVSDEGIFTMEEEYVPDDTADATEALSGQGGVYSYTFKGMKPGEATVTFVYSQSWDADSTAATVSYTVKVNDDLSVVCVASSLGL